MYAKIRLSLNARTQDLKLLMSINVGFTVIFSEKERRPTFKILIKIIISPELLTAV